MRCLLHGKDLRSPRAFTLIEVLVVVAIIALLVAILLPSLALSRKLATRTVCAAHQKGLMSAIQMYTMDYKGWTHQSPNQGLWDNSHLKGSETVRMYGPNEANAYWGIAYYKYSKNKKVFACPAQTRVDDWPENGWGVSYQPYFQYCSYGLNGLIANAHGVRKPRFKGDRPGMILDSDFKRPAVTIAFQDHIEQRMETPYHGRTDTLNMGRNGKNLWQWRTPPQSGWFPNALQECFRHVNTSNTAWLDGHVSEIKNSPEGKNIPLEWYTGGLSWKDLPWVEDP